MPNTTGSGLNIADSLHEVTESPFLEQIHDDEIEAFETYFDQQVGQLTDREFTKLHGERNFRQTGKTLEEQTLCLEALLRAKLLQTFTAITHTIGSETASTDKWIHTFLIYRSNNTLAAARCRFQRAALSLPNHLSPSVHIPKPRSAAQTETAQVHRVGGGVTPTTSHTTGHTVP